jgi:peptide/nickel transport system ATP-binding protein
VPGRCCRGESLRQIPGMTPSLLDLAPGCAFRERCPRADAACREDPELSTPVAGRQVRCFHPLTQSVAA